MGTGSVGDGEREWERGSGEEKEELEEEDGEEEPCAAVVEGEIGFEGGEV